MKIVELHAEVQAHWAGRAVSDLDAGRGIAEVRVAPEALAEFCGRLFLEWEFAFAGLVIDDSETKLAARYIFPAETGSGFVHVLVERPAGSQMLPSIVKFVHAADWHEREASDLYGIAFEGHPRLGDFALHREIWPEGAAPMRRGFEGKGVVRPQPAGLEWRPQRVVQETGAFIFPIGPKFSGVTESAHFLLETVGEDVIRSIPRLFYKWRAVEKTAEGRKVEDVLLLAERFSATSAFAHGLAFCQAIESVGAVTVSPRARQLRILLAELERLRQHAGAIADICESTALVVAASQAGLFEEDLLRISEELCGHRYLFGLLSPGGMLRDLDTEPCAKAAAKAMEVTKRLNNLEQNLRLSSSFLDRLEEVGAISTLDAKTSGLVGPMARASGYVCDLRKAQPYGGYETMAFDVPRELEGDGYARLRLLFAEARQSARIMEQAAATLPAGPVATTFRPIAGAGLGWVEAPRGAAFHWVQVSPEGTVAKYHIVPPSFCNWLGFHAAVEKFAFQDFPIVLATLDLSSGESDR